jgi:hypothetical protein
VLGHPGLEAPAPTWYGDRVRIGGAIAVALAGCVGAGVAVGATAGERPTNIRGSTPSVGTGVAGTGTVVTPAKVKHTGAPGGTTAAKAPSSQLTHPRVRPRVGWTRTIFTLSFTLRQNVGHSGVVASEYRVQVTPPYPRQSRCWPAEPRPIRTGTAGTIKRIRLHPPARGWCRGRYRVTVYLERGPYCPPPTYGKPPAPCPEFVTTELDVGDARFSIR